MYLMIHLLACLIIHHHYYYCYTITTPKMKHTAITINSREGPTEVSRVYSKDTWEPWVEKIFFYAFPAPTLLFPPGQADDDAEEFDVDNEVEEVTDVDVSAAGQVVKEGHAAAEK
jgi:hypothetical protein